jgi:hypothetical protein
MKMQMLAATGDGGGAAEQERRAGETYEDRDQHGGERAAARIVVGEQGREHGYLLATG